jgi:hypothetical protein
MACKMWCPQCKKVLKEEGDESKEAQGEYRVYNSDKGLKNYRVLKCLLCGYVSDVEKWSDYEIKQLLKIEKNNKEKKIK